MTEELFGELSEAVVIGDIERAKESVNKLLESGQDAYQIIERSISPGLEVVGEKFEAREYFITDLLVSANVAKEVMGLLEPHMSKTEEKSRAAKVVIGTVEGDIHDIGKNIVATMLRGAGFEVVDLGVDISAQDFVSSANKEKAGIVAMSALLTSTMLKIPEVIEAFRKAGIRDEVKVLVGGAPLNEDFARKVGADAYGKDALRAIEKARELAAG